MNWLDCIRGGAADAIGELRLFVSFRTTGIKLSSWFEGIPSMFWVDTLLEKIF